MVNPFIRTVTILVMVAVFGPINCIAGGSGSAETDAVGEKTRISPEVDSLLVILPDFVHAAFVEAGLPSLSIALVHDREIIYSQAMGFADLANKTPVTTKTIYPIASITKLFVTTMLVQLVEKGVVSLDSPVETYLSEYRVQSPYEGTLPTTLRQLATHTSGLPKDANGNFWSDYAAGNWLFSAGKSEMVWYVSKEELLASLPDTRLEYPPNSRYSYSNLGMVLLGIALERAAGIPFTEYIESHILEPLGMYDTGFHIRKEQPARVPVGYVYLDASSDPIAAPEWNLGSALYSGGLYSTVEDMARFLSLQFQADEPGGAQIVSADGLRMMHLESLGWGYVWDPQYKGIEHSGGHLGFYAYVRAYPGLKIGVVALTNSYNPLQEKNPSEEIARAILGELKKALPARDSFDPEQVDLRKYAGTYTLPGADADITIEFQNGRLRAALLQDPDFDHEINMISKNEFGIDNNPEPWLVFVEDDTKRVRSLRFFGYTFIKKP